MPAVEAARSREVKGERRDKRGPRSPGLLRLPRSPGVCAGVPREQHIWMLLAGSGPPSPRATKLEFN